MVLSPQTSAWHNSMRGEIIRHPASTNFDEQGEDVPPTKKLRRHESTESLVSSNASITDGVETKALAADQRVIPDSEAEDEEDEDEDSLFVTGNRPTELESALPPVKTDREAIDDYEATKAAADADGFDREVRLGQRKWVKGRNSIYVDAFNLALETVLEDEGHLFDEAELALFQHWRQLDYQAQYLYVRIFLRKTSAWHRINRLGYYADIGDLLFAAETLQSLRNLPPSSAGTQNNPGELEPPKGTTLSSTFTFADRSEEQISTLEEASSLLTLDELKALARELKVQGKNKADLLRALRRTSRRQSGLEWGGLRRTESEETTASTGSGYEADNAVRDEFCTADPVASTVGRDGHFLRKILSCTGPCIRLSLAPLKLFERVHLVFYRSTEWTEKSLTTIILARIARRNFPDYIVSRSTNVFPSRSMLLEFEAAMRTQFRVDNILEFNGNPTRDGLQAVLDIFEEVHPRWRVLLEEEQGREDRVYESGEGAYLRRFSPAWVYTRLVHKGAHVLGRLKHHKQEHDVLSELLDQQLFHSSRRGGWYQRKALLEEHYMAALSPREARSSESQKKLWKKIALQTCEVGLQDKECHHIYHYDLQKRISKLEKSLKVVKREQHDFGHVKLVKPFERFVEGTRLQNERLPSARRASDPNNGRGGKTVWIDGREDGGECRVEDMCLSWYRGEGWKGYHSEGGIVRTLFAYLFYDILFIYIPNVFQSPYQTCPLDLHTDAFYASRASEINHRLVEIANGGAERIIREVDAREREKQTCVVGLDWAFELDDLIEIASCFDGEALATICKVMAQEYGQRGGGIPDLFLWHPTNKTLCFSEVKSENDRLSDTQRLWIHVLTVAGIRVELCNAVAKEVRVVNG